jgi:hypothetical protein
MTSVSSTTQESATVPEPSNVATSSSRLDTPPPLPSGSSTSQERRHTKHTESERRSTRSTSSAATNQPTNKKTKKSKPPKLTAGLVLKKKDIPSLVQKWQKIKDEEL